MNEFLTRYAIKHGKLGLSKTYVLTEISENPKKMIVAYYTLASSTIARKNIPIQQSLPTYPIPVVMLARLAIDIRYQGQGLGAKTLTYALRQAVNLNEAGLPAYGLLLDVLDEQALMFYQSFEIFLPLADNPMRLFVPVKTLEQI